jgi:cation-transporting ATPase I
VGVSLPLPGLGWPLVRRRRHVWSSAGRAHVEIRVPDDHEPIAAAISKRLGEVRGVHWAALVPALARVVISFDEDEVDLDALVEVIDALERDHGVADRSFDTSRAHPGDTAPLVREALALAADGVAVGLAVAGKLGRLAHLPVEAAAAIPLVQSQPRLRNALEAAIGRTPAGVGLSIANAALQGFAQGPLGLVVDAALRASRLAELTAIHDIWRVREPELLSPGRIRESASALAPAVRPVPLPDGPVEQYADRAGLASLGSLAIAFATTRDLRRAAAAALAAMPKASHVGREVFASHLGRLLARRGVVCLDPEVLRRLDRIDCIAIDRRVLVTGAKSISRMEFLGEPDEDERLEIHRQVHQLLSGRRTHVRSQAGWRLRRLDRDERQRLDVRRLQHDASPSETLGLAHHAELVALVVVEDELAPGAVTLVATARRAGHMVAIAGDEQLADRLGADISVPSGAALAESVQMLQTDGCSVALVCGDDPRALASADCAIGIVLGDRVPWAAHLLTEHTLEGARLVIEASGVAYEVSRQNVALALGGSSLGTVMALSMPMPGATARAMTAVNLAALLAEANGLRAAVALNRRPVPVETRQPPWHELEADDVLVRLKTRPEGLTEAEAAARFEPAPEDRMPSLPLAVAGELANPLTPVLSAAAAVSATVGSLTDAAMVSAVVALNGLIGGVQRYQVEHALRALEHESDPGIRVRRAGAADVIPATDIVVGDVVQLDAGEVVPADCRVLTASGVELDESAVTGESVPVAKSPAARASLAVGDRSSMLWAGTSVAAGSVTGVVVATGVQTEARRAELIDDDSPARTGVEVRLRDLTRATMPVSFLGGLGVTAAGAVRGIPLRETLRSGISLAVAAVPEGLPILATMAQLSAARRLATRGALVRNPRAIEALGRIDLLCADKTGTLTEGRIQLHSVFDGERELALDALSPSGRDTVIVGLRASPEEQADEDPLPHLTDRAVVFGGARIGLDTNGGDGHWERIAELPFEPGRGYHAVLGRNGRGPVLSVKGAPEVVLPRCEAWRDPAGDVPLDEARTQAMFRAVERLARRGRRILAVAEREASSKADLDDERVARLRLLGFLVLADPVRPTAARAVADLARAGVRVVMLTGDHPSTAAGVAAGLGLLDGGSVLTGPEIDQLDDAALDDALGGVSVFARVTPSHKVRLVQAYQRVGRTVAMTGDGANDAAAIKLADVGIALGEHSTSSARRAADVVVPDGRIETILDAVIEGRGMWSSVRDALSILLGGNLGEVGFTVAGAWLTGRSPLNARQLLLVNLMTDVLPAMAIAVRPPPNRSAIELVDEGPEASLGRSLDQALITRAVATALGAGAAWAVASASGRPRRASTVALVALVGTQLGQTLTSGRRDLLVMAAVAGSSAVLSAVVQTPGVSQLFGCTPLGPTGWTIAVTSAAGATAGSVLVPAIWRHAQSYAGLLRSDRSDDDVSERPNSAAPF